MVNNLIYIFLTVSLVFTAADLVRTYYTNMHSSICPEVQTSDQSSQEQLFFSILVFHEVFLILGYLFPSHSFKNRRQFMYAEFSIASYLLLEQMLEYLIYS